uniref:Putative secreted protein n=1 Tax=Ixodes ricinus TaxID=34613 RepID=A0A6B0UBI1_IXORI
MPFSLPLFRKRLLFVPRVAFACAMILAPRLLFLGRHAAGESRDSSNVRQVRERKRETCTWCVSTIAHGIFQNHRPHVRHRACVCVEMCVVP